MTYDLSLLDQSPVGPAMCATDALTDTLERAEAADACGFRRVWFAEHHGSTAFAGTNPQTLAAMALERTGRITVGTGGVLLGNHDPVCVAENFLMMARVHPGRVDAGVGRAGTDQEDFRRRVEHLKVAMGTSHRRPEDGSITTAQPTVPLWILGTGPASAEHANDVGAGFVYGHFFNATGTARSFAALRPDTSRILAVRVVTHPDADLAARLTERFLVWRSLRDLGVDAPFPSLDIAEQLSVEPAVAERMTANASRVVAGPPAAVRAQLSELASTHRVGEVMVTIPIPERAFALAALSMLVAAPSGAG